MRLPKFFPRIFPPRSRILFYLAIAAIIVLVKIPLIKKFELREMSGPIFKEDILARRAYLSDRLITNKLSVDDMPSYLGKGFRGEWLTGTYSMFVAGVTNISFLYPETRADSIPMVRQAIEEVLRPGTREFDRDAWGEDPLENIENESGHIGYLGHLAWMISAFKILGGDNQFDDLFEKIIQSLRRSIREPKHHCAETFPGQIFIPDNVVVIAALINYDRIFGLATDSEVTDWIETAKKKLIDPRTGLLYFSLESDGSPSSGSRGSGAGWNSFYLPFIDPAFARDQYKNMKANLTDTTLGTFMGVREYPRGIVGLGDVDSGPVILGLSPSGTGFAVAGARRAGDTKLFTEFLFTGEAIGTTVSFNGKRRYLFAPLVGDAILLAMKTATEWPTTFVSPLGAASTADARPKESS